MKGKFFPLFSLLTLCVFLFLKQFSNQGPVDSFTALMNAEIAKLRAMEGEHEEGHFDNPEMFGAFDRMQRINPATGEIPPFALLNAWMDVQQQISMDAYTNYALSWIEKGPSGIGGRTRVLMYDKNDATNKTVWAAAVGGGLWKTTNITSTTPGWVNKTPLLPNIAVCALAQDPSNPQIIYFGTGEGYPNADAIRGAGIWKSVDGGNNWDVLPASLNASFYFCTKFVVTSNGDFYAGTKGGLYKSTNQGNSFSKVVGTGTNTGQDNINDVEIAANGDLYVAIHSSGIYKSAASLGASQGNVGSWTSTPTNSFTGSFTRVEIACAASNASILYALIANTDGETDKVYKSTNAGGSWAPCAAQPNSGNDFSNGQAWYDLAIEVGKTNANIVLVGGIDFYKTTNGGTSWSHTTYGYGGSPYVHPDQHTLTFKPGSDSEIVFGNDGGVYYTSNGGPNVTERNTGYNVTQFYAMAINPKSGNNIAIGGTQDNGTILVNQPGIGVGDPINGADGGYCAIDHAKPDTMYVTTQYQTLRRSRNGGNSFTSITNTNLNNSNTLFINPMEMDPNNANYLYQGSTNLWRHLTASSGSAANWTKCTATLPGNVTAIGISKSTTNLVYIGVSGQVQRIPNANTGTVSTVPSVVNPPGLPAGYIKCVAVNPADGNHLIVTFTNYGLPTQVAEIKNANLGAGATYRSLKGNLPDLPVSWAIFEPGNNNGLLIATDLGVFRCGDITQPAPQVFWTPERIGMGFPRVDMLRTRTSDKWVFACTHGRGFFSTNSYSLPPQAAFGVVSTSACAGNIQFVDSSSNAPTTWLWNFGDGTTSTTQHPFHNYASSGSYNVNMRVSNANGQDSVLQSFTINVLVGPVAEAGPDTIYCSGDTVSLYGSGGVSYQWSPSGAFFDPNVANPSFVVSTPVTFTLTVTDANGCIATDTVRITSASPPNTWAGSDHTITWVGDSAQLTGFGGTTFSWSPATGLSCTTCQNPKAAPSATTIYTLISGNAAGCTRSDNVTVFYSLVGVDPAIEPALSFQLNTWPNPAKDKFNVSFYLAETGHVDMQLISLDGKTIQKIASENYPKGKNEIQVNVQSSAKGIYFLRFISDGKEVVKKILLN